MIALVSGRGRGPPRRPRRRLAAAASATGSRSPRRRCATCPASAKPATLFTHLIVRDDALLLYGFATEEERDLFLLLLGVQSVGPKMALAVLSGGPPRELLAAVAAGDTARLQAVPGHRQAHRRADRRRAAREGRRGRGRDDPIVITRTDDPRALAREGLLGLGFSPAGGRRAARRRPRRHAGGPDRPRPEGRRADDPHARAPTSTASRPRACATTTSTRRALRPRRLDEFVGQEALKAQLELSIRAAAARGEALDHVLFAGPPGLGKTSPGPDRGRGARRPVHRRPPARRWSARPTSRRFLTSLEPGQVFFVDEIHRLPRAVEETFYPAMEDGQLPITLGVGPGAKVVDAADRRRSR